MAMPLTLAEFERMMRFDLETYQANGIEAIGQTEGHPHHRWRVYTDNNVYTFSAAPLTERSPMGYLGCTSLARRERAGEDWHRGSDLADGPLTLETWRKILADIVSYEMVKVHDKKKALKDAEVRPGQTFYDPTGYGVYDPADIVGHPQNVSRETADMQPEEPEA